MNECEEDYCMDEDMGCLMEMEEEKSYRPEFIR